MASISMEGDDSQLVDSILRDMNSSGSSPAQNMGSMGPMGQMGQMPPPSNSGIYDQNTLNMIQMNQQQASPMTHQIDPQLYAPIQQQAPRQKVEVAYNNSAVNWNLLWKRIKYPLIVFIICMIVFNPDLYNILARTIPSIFTAPTKMRLYLRTFILSAMVALLYGIVIMFV
jgi:hypothetical protein